MGWLELVAIPLAARICLVVLFPFSGIDKIIHWKDALAQAKSTPVPFVRTLLVLAIIVELVTPLCIIFGWHDRLAAFVLAGFCVMTAALYHQFWRFADFWAPGESVARGHFWDFLKNFGLVGGLLLVMIGTALR
jgi:putative oxidoreductase